ncbi:MAG: leucine-rich repeat protein, partial [Clostridia bacterium]|nr:leucine-rich repeat protein [Clostridia bacterium]
CTSLTSVIIGNGVTSIGYGAFRNCTSLTSITIGDSVTSIGDDAFGGCTSLKEVHISDIASWCNILFDDYDSNPLYYAKKLYINNELVTKLVIPDTVTKINDYAFRNCTSLTSVIIGNGVTTIGDRVFRDCTSLTSVIIGNCVTTIGDWAFYNCTSLTSVAIGNSVTSMRSNPFDGCTSLKEVHISDIASWCNISFGNYDSNPLFYAKNLYLNGELVTELVIPNTVTKINAYAFYNCTSLTSVTFENTSGWYVTKTQGATSGTNVDVTSATTNATNLKSNYVDYYWYRIAE